MSWFSRFKAGVATVARRLRPACMRSYTGIDYFFLGSALTAAPSVLLYLLVPQGTALWFGASRAVALTSTVAFWVRVTAAGDALYTYAALLALRYPHRGFQILTLRGLLLYGCLHFGAFWYAHTFGEPHPGKQSLMYAPSIGILVLANWYWGKQVANTELCSSECYCSLYVSSHMSPSNACVPCVFSNRLRPCCLRIGQTVQTALQR